MDDTKKASSAVQRLADLTKAYREILRHYREIERLSREERRLLTEGKPVARVNEVLRRKRDTLRAIRVEEESVGGEREWWKRIRRSLPPASCADLLSLLDAVSGSIQNSLALEAECRSLLEGAVRGRAATMRPEAAAAKTAAVAYTRAAAPGAPR